MRAAPDRDVVVALDGVEVRLEQTDVLHGVTWEVRTHERWVVLGPNGSGKTTMLRVLTGYEYARRGQVTILGQRLGHTDVRVLRRRIGIAGPAVGSLIRPQLDVGDVVLTGKTAALAPWWDTFDDDDRQRAGALLERVGCSALAGHAFGTLSSGEGQRVLLARALMSEPGLVLLDEPAAGLDLPGREDLLGVLADLAGDETSPPVVMVTHHLEEVPAAFTHGLLMRAGTVVAAGPLADVLRPEELTTCFGRPIAVEHQAGRWWARAVPTSAATPG